MQLLEITQSDPSTYPCRLRELARDAAAAQERSLMDILSWAQDTEYGRAHGFADIGSVADYIARVPETDYEDYKPLIDRMYEGEESLLFPGSPVSFVFSSGTTGDAKTFPESACGDALKKAINRMRSFEIARMLEGRRGADYKIFALTNTSNYGTNAQGIPVGTASGLALAQAKYTSSIQSVPAAFTSVGYLTGDDQNYCFAFFALRDRRVQELACNNVAHFIRVLDLIQEQAPQLLDDIERGTLSVDFRGDDKEQVLAGVSPDPERADELRAIYAANGELRIEDFWPDFCCVGCWLSGSVGRITREYVSRFPEDTVFIHWGYGASESKFDVTLEPDVPYGVPVTFGSFLELKDVEDGGIALLSDAVPGRLYELVITTYSGLYRYNLHDLVRVHMGADSLPRMEFVCKSKDKVCVDGRTLYAGELQELVERYEAASSEQIRLFQGRVTADGLTLYVEPVAAFDKERFADMLRDALATKGIPLAEVVEYEQGYRNSLYSKVVEGKSVSSTKLPVFLP